MIRIISDGINHKVLNEDGTILRGVKSVTIHQINPHEIVTATLVFENVKLDITTDDVIQIAEES